MSRLSGFIDPETRAYVEAVTAAVRPGRHLPDGTLVETADNRSPAQRCHDGVKLGLKAGIASGGLGSHRGHPVTVIVRTTLAELNQAAHAVNNPDVSMPAPARTGGATALPMRDVIRMGARPNCLEPGYHSEVHHSPDWSPDGRTDADTLFFACAPDHKLVSDGHQHTTVTDTGRLAWTDGTPPPEINHAHHPEELLRGNTDPPDTQQK